MGNVLPADLDTSTHAGTANGGAVVSQTSEQRALSVFEKHIHELRQTRELVQRIAQDQKHADMLAAVPGLIAQLKEAIDTGPPPIETPIPPGSPGPIFTGDPLYLTYQLDQVAVSGSSSGTLPVLNLGAAPYNAVADSGATDNGPIINTALNDLKTAGCGWLAVPPPATPGHFYGYGTPVSCTQLNASIISGIGYGRHLNQNPALVYTGTGAGTAFQLLSPVDVKIEGLNFEWSQGASFTGNLVMEESSGASDCFGNVITGCGFGPTGSGITANLLTVSAWLNGEIEKCNFGFGNRQVVWGDQSSAHGVYVNGSTLRDSSFGKSALNPIYLLGQDTEVCSFEDLTFEPLNSGVAGAFEGNGTIMYELLFKNMFVAEGASNGGTVFKSMYTAGRPSMMIGGEIGGEAGNGFGATGSIACDFRGSWMILGTQFNGGAGASVFSDPGGNQFRLHWIGGGMGGGTGSAFAGTLPSPRYILGVGNVQDYLAPIAQVVQRNALTNFSPNSITQGMFGQFLEVTRGGSATVTIQGQSIANYAPSTGGWWCDVWNSNATSAGAAVVATSGSAVTIPASPTIPTGTVSRFTQVATDVWAVSPHV